MISNKNPGVPLRRLIEESQKQFAENIPSSAQDERSDNALKPAENQKTRMTETKIYIGLNDATTKEQLFDTEKYMSVLKYVCHSYHVAFSVNVEEGGYFHDDGEYTEETSFVLVLINTDQKIIHEIAKDLCSFFNQESVLITENHIEGYFISGNPIK